MLPSSNIFIASSISGLNSPSATHPTSPPLAEVGELENCWASKGKGAPSFICSIIASAPCIAPGIPPISGVDSINISATL